MNATESSTNKSFLHIIGEDYSDLFNKSLRSMNNYLIRKKCDHITHYDCMQKTTLSARNVNELLAAFLNRVLLISRVQKTLFCSAHFTEVNKTKLIANLRGVWYKKFDKEIIHVNVSEEGVYRNKEKKLVADIFLVLKK